MGWRQNMGAAEKKNNISNPIDNIDRIDKTPSRTVENDTFVNIVSFVNRNQNVKTPEIIIKKMSACLHGKPCRFISLVNDRQVCRKNNQPIFDMAACPAGKWERFKDKPKPKKKTKKTMTCPCCGGQAFWRNTSNNGGRFICGICHPPILDKGEAEWLQ